MTPDILDLTRDLKAVAFHSTTPEAVDDLLGEALEALGHVLPFDLATIMELEDGGLQVRVAEGTLRRPEVLRHRLDLEQYPTLRQVLKGSRARAFLEDDHAHGDGDAFDGVLDLPPGHSCMVVPLRTEDEVLGLMTLDRTICQPYAPAHVQLAEIFGRLLASAMNYGEQSVRLCRLRSQLEEQNRALIQRVSGELEPGALLEASLSPRMQQVVHQAKQVATTVAPVLITGETGTGKEVLARAIHGWSPRRENAMVTVNCTTLPAGLMESELFGHVKGAFTGATTSRLGRFQAANGGTLLLDEVGEIPVELQPKLLRVLQEGCFEPVGSDRTVRVDVRVIAATNVDLEQACREQTFREDLYYRLAVFPIHVPSLRDRLEDLPIIARSALLRLAGRAHRPGWELTEEDLAWLRSRPWRGNIRELINTLERATILGQGSSLDLGDGIASLAAPPEPVPQPAGGSFPTLTELERRHIEDAMRRTEGRIHGEGGAAELLGLHPSTLHSRMRKLGLGGARDYRRRLDPD